jgi:hypothetical protein
LGIGYLHGHRSFEYLGATSSSSTTPSPGKSSFTSALIWAFEQFAEEAVPKKFTMTELANKIRDAPNFPREQVPTLIARDPQCSQRIVLSPLPSKGEEDAGAEEPKEVVPEYLELRFYFDKAPNDHELKDLALALTRHINNSKGGSLYRVSFGGLYSVVQNAVRIWTSKWRSSTQTNHPVSTSPSPNLAETTRAGRKRTAPVRPSEAAKRGGKRGKQE